MHHDKGNRPKLPYITMVEFLLVLGSVMVFAGFLMAWVGYTDVIGERATAVTVTGLEFGRKIASPYPEILLVPFLTLFVLGFALLSAGRRRSDAKLPVSKGFGNGFRALSLICGLMSLILMIEVVYRYGTRMETDIGGLSFWYNIRLGWYVTLFGILLVMVGSGLSFAKNYRKVGFSDYVFMRAPREEAIPPMALAGGPMHVYAGAPQMPPQRM